MHWRYRKLPKPKVDILQSDNGLNIGFLQCHKIHLAIYPS